MSTEALRYGVVGLGRAGWSIHVAGLRNRPDAKIVAVTDPDPARRQQAETELQCKSYATLPEMLRKQKDIDVVVVATPSVLHGPDTKKALKAGRHVVVEKPMAMSVSEAKSMIAAAQKADRKLFVHQNYRFFPEFQFYYQTIKSGILGRVYNLRLNIQSFVRRNDWQTLSKNGGGLLNNTMPHFIDQAVQMLGSPVKRVVGDLQQIVSAGDVEDHVKIMIWAENGCTADLEACTAANVATKLPKWIIYGTAGTLTCDGKTATINWFDPAQVQPLEAVDGAAQNRKYGNEDKLPWQTKTIEAAVPYQNFYDNVYGVLRRGEPMVVTPESVLDVMHVIEGTRKGTKFPGTLPMKVTKPAVTTGG